MPAGYGICRLGYYARVQEEIIRNLGYNVEIVQIGVSDNKLFGMLSVIKRLAK